MTRDDAAEKIRLALNPSGSTVNFCGCMSCVALGNNALAGATALTVEAAYAYDFIRAAEAVGLLKFD